MAPEIWKGQKYDEKVDVWATGMIVYLLVAGRFPFTGKNENALKKSILQTPLSFSGKEWNNVSQDCILFITSCLQKDQKARATAEQLLMHPWLN